jgi:hypothetical protein
MTTDQLNHRFGTALGFHGIESRFAWKFSADVPFFLRRGLLHGWERHTWADRIGQRWMLCQLKAPEMSQTEWILSFGTRPYPENGEYIPHAETALPPGMEPTVELTDGYIATIRKQMEQAEFAGKENFAGRKDPTTELCEAQAQKQVDDAEKEFMEKVADWEPLSWKLGEPHHPGDQDGAVAFQVGGTRDMAGVRDSNPHPQ